MATFASRPAENADPWYGARETYDQSLENAIAANEAALAGKVPTTRTVAGKALSVDVTLVKGDVGLGNVDNTSDAAKPISTATQTALDARLATADAPELIRDTMGTALVAGANVTITPDDVADTITIAAAGGGGGVLPASLMSSWIAGPSSLGSSSHGTQAFDANKLYVTAIAFDRALTAAQMGIEVKTASTAGHFRLGLCTFDGTVVGESVEGLTATTGYKTVSLVSPTAVDAGWYLLVLILDEACSLQGFTPTTRLYAPITSPSWNANLWGNVLSASRTYGALPNPLGTLSNDAAARAPHIGVEVS